MTSWKGIIGKAFTPAQFTQYCQTFKLQAWHPRFCVVHNTQIPNFAAWHKVPGADRMRALERYYRDEKGWSGGPHLFVADDLIWAFTPLSVPGVHSPSWNTLAWGVEMVGDYDNETLSLSVLSNTISALTDLHRLGKLDPQNIRLHKEDPKTDHNCPGKNVHKDVIINSVSVHLGLIPAATVILSPVLRRGSSDSVAIAELQRLLRMSVAAPGIFGPLTEAEVIKFQLAHNLEGDGVVGAKTWAALRAR